jgi:hypothetical protein
MQKQSLENISHIYRNLINSNRAYASFRDDELEIIKTDIISEIKSKDWILDPMSGYGGLMRYSAIQGYKTCNIEINPPAYFWQLLTNPRNKNKLEKIINNVIKEIRKLPKLKNSFSINDSLFTKEIYEHIIKLYNFIFNAQPKRTNEIEKLIIAILLPFSSRFANYIKSDTNITHFKEGGFCSYKNWEEDFKSYLSLIFEKVLNTKYEEKEHENILGDIFKIKSLKRKFKFFVTSPPYPNYRDYSKIFKIENRILSDVFNYKDDFNNLIGSNVVKNKSKSKTISKSANRFLDELLQKSKTLNKKAKNDINAYYHPYFSIYFTQIQEAFIKVNQFLTNKATGYIVVSDNITRDIIIPVGEVIKEIFKYLGYETKTIDLAQISHYGNIGRSAKRLNSKHTRHIIKVWKK